MSKVLCKPTLLCHDGPVSYGFFSIAGVQSGTAQASQMALGPFALPFGSATESSPVLVNTTATVPVPTGALGVAIIPPIGNTTPTLQFSMVSSGNASAGNYIAPGTPSVIEFDSAHVPANIYLVSGASVTVQVQFT